MLDSKKANEIKEQIYSQIDSSNIPNKEEIKSQIANMSEKELEDFLKEQAPHKNQECVFCSIALGKIPSKKVRENDGAIAALEINPISLGHTIIIPKIHSNEINPETNNLAGSVAKTLKTLKPKSIEIVPSEMFGHKILNVFGVYENENINSPRKKANTQELEKIEKLFLEKPSANGGEKDPIKKESKQKSKKPERVTDKDMWLPKRKP